ncbi:MAG: threonine synthase [Candidatus Heimdallarchaeota archaeon]
MIEIYCTRCGRAQDKYTEWRCPCGGPFEIHNETPFECDNILLRDHTIWRYRKILPPIEPKSIVSLGEGMTPLVPLETSPARIYAKLEYVSPTGSLKDRGVTVMVSNMKEEGVKKAIEDSSGNAGASVAAYCARAAIGCEIFVPEKVRVGKATQIVAYGATLRKIPGGREAATAAARNVAAHTFYASHHWNPFYLQGKETMAYEIVEQLEWNAPDYVFIPVGSGSTFYGAIKGFTKLISVNIIDSYPTLIGVQSDQCAPLYSALTGSPFDVKAPINTIADGISVRTPARLDDIVKAVKQPKAEVDLVSDPEIIDSLKTLGGKGFFVEPTSAVVYAAWQKRLKKGQIDAEDCVVLVLTGIGLKTIDTMVPIFPMSSHKASSS